MTLRARWVTLRARWVTLRDRWVTLRARWVTLRDRWVTLRARWVTLRAHWVETAQLLCPAECYEPLGFLCIVNAQRDKPVALKRLADGTFEEILGAVSACEFIPKHLRKPGDPGYKPPN